MTISLNAPRKAIYPGTFDPITNGHLDVLERACAMFDEIQMVVAKNSSKTPMFSEEERLAMIHSAIERFPNVSAQSFQGLTVDYARSFGAIAIIRGLRAVSDFEYEMQIALMNRKIAPELTTVFLMPHEKYTYLNSSIIRELARHGQSVRGFVPESVAAALEAKYPLRVQPAP
jgi:pantetheine-phosphate adenylyltransferase